MSDNPNHWKWRLVVWEPVEDPLGVIKAAKVISIKKYPGQGYARRAARELLNVRSLQGSRRRAPVQHNRMHWRWKPVETWTEKLPAEEGYEHSNGVQIETSLSRIR